MSADATSRGINASRTGYVPSHGWRVGFWACIVISIAAVLRRGYALLYPPHGAPPQLAALDAVFAAHATLTLAHIVPALAFVAVSPFAVFRTSAGTAWPERLLFPLGGLVGLTAYAMSVYAIGGWVERSAVLLFSTFFCCHCFTPTGMRVAARIS